MYFITHRDIKDDSIDYICFSLTASSKHKAWKKFINLVGKDKEYWNKLGYVAAKIKIEKITIEI